MIQLVVLYITFTSQLASRLVLLVFCANAKLNSRSVLKLVLVITYHSFAAGSYPIPNVCFVFIAAAIAVISSDVSVVSNEGHTLLIVLPSSGAAEIDTAPSFVINIPVSFIPVPSNTTLKTLDHVVTLAVLVTFIKLP